MFDILLFKLAVFPKLLSMKFFRAQKIQTDISRNENNVFVRDTQKRDNLRITCGVIILLQIL
jgi:hypothetical protein